MANANWIKTIGTQTGAFCLGLLGVRLKNSGGNLIVRNNADSANAEVIASKFQASGDVGLVINSDATGAGADWKVTLQRDAVNMTGDVTFTLPADDGVAGYHLQTDGDGVLSWVESASNPSNWQLDSTSFAFGAGATVTMFTLPANAVVDSVKVIVDTAFDGAPSMSVGTAGNASKYVGSGDVNLLVNDRYDIPNQSIPVGTTEDLEITYAAGGATVGAGRVLVSFGTPQ